ncbi:MAG: TonB-dependent receptor, partial [Phaeodactylibacter sp.]|nr:TonB-dependent receptor [Phaeodactylibacter sp.]
LLPGVLSGGEGNTGFYVRGGGPDQNLILLDEAVVYNSGHLLGFFSVFNADAIKSTKLYKGAMPAEYGGRLSSVVDVRMREGNNKYHRIEGGLGLVASRITAQGPLQKDKSSYILSGRRSYAFDLAQPFIKNTDFAGTNYNFYDLNTKVNYQFSDRDRLYLSGYFGRDVLRYQSGERAFYFDMTYGNATATLRWNHLLSDKWFMNFSLIFNDYDFELAGGQAEFGADVYSGIRDWNAKLDLDYSPGTKHYLQLGSQYTYHRITPSIATATNGEIEFSNDLQPQYAKEAGWYVQDEWRLHPSLAVNMGLRLSYFQRLGPYTSKSNGQVYEQGEPAEDYWGLEPRLTLRWRTGRNSSIKGGLARTYQYLHLVSNSTSTLPLDVWVPSSELVKPQIGWQYGIGYFQNLFSDNYETAVEVYYKDLQNQIDYRENYVNNVADDLESQFVFGTGRSYGVELFFKKRFGDLNGWIGYTWSKTERIFPEINQGLPYPTTYDRRHDVSVVGNYQLSDRWSFGAIFVYGTGNAFTPLKSLYLIEQNLTVEYGGRNSARLPAYHRLDLSATFTPKPEAARQRRFYSDWTFSIYNVYNRQNPFFVYYYLDTDLNAGSAKASAYQVSLFPIIPSVSWNFRWHNGQN